MSKAKPARDEGGNPICGGCRNRVDESATTCEHCGATIKNGYVDGVIALCAVALLALLPGTPVIALTSLFVVQNSVVFGVALIVLTLAMAVSTVVAIVLPIQLYRTRPHREFDPRKLVPFG